MGWSRYKTGTARGNGRGHDVKELALISVAAVFGLILAWHVQADYFAMFFAASAAIAIMQAVRWSL
jgi:hypothetical protein